MATFSKYVVASADDGGSEHDGSSFFVIGSDYLGRLGSMGNRIFARFTGVTIPAGSTITSAKITLRAYYTRTGQVCRAIVHCEADADPAAPSDGADLIGRSLTTGTPWIVPPMTADLFYDSDDIASEVQEVIDLAGWTSGNAITVHLLDNVSDFNDHRVIGLYDIPGDAPELVIEYTAPVIGDSVDSFSISDVVDGDLPGVGEIADGFSVQDVIDAQNTSAGIANLFVFGDTVDAQSELQALAVESFSFDDIIEGYKEADSEFSDSFGFADNLDAFHYSNWLRANLIRASQRFFFILTGAADGLSDVTIPITSFYARKNTGDPTFVQVVVPGWAEWAEEIADRPNGDLIVKMGYEVGGVVTLLEQILIADLEEIRMDKGASNRSITLSGHRSQSYAQNLITIAENKSSYYSLQKNAIVYRFAHIDPYLNAGDVCKVGTDTFTVVSVIYIVNVSSSMMEVREGPV